MTYLLPSIILSGGQTGSMEKVSGATATYGAVPSLDSIASERA
jgi:hypothetical protein